MWRRCWLLAAGRIYLQWSVTLTRFSPRCRRSTADLVLVQAAHNVLTSEPGHWLPADLNIIFYFADFCKNDFFKQYVVGYVLEFYIDINILKCILVLNSSYSAWTSTQISPMNAFYYFKLSTDNRLDLDFFFMDLDFFFFVCHPLTRWIEIATNATMLALLIDRIKLQM